MLIDSHCHLGMLDASNEKEGLSAFVTRANEAGVKHMLTIGIDLESSSGCLALAKEYDCVSASVGIHPCDVKNADLSQLVALSTLAEAPEVVAIGETGLDYYHDQIDLGKMQDFFRRHINLAKAVSKPLVIHSRDAREDTIKILREEGADQVRGVMHCFTESVEMAEQAMALGFYISFSGIVTFKNAKNVHQVAKAVPLERMLVETDAPYLAPTPYRGKPNEPAYVRLVAEYLAELKGVSYDELVSVTGQNCRDLFSLNI